MLQITNPEIFAAVVESAKRATMGDARWCKAIDEAARQIETNPYLSWEGTHLLILSDSNEIYTANGACQCRAFEFHKACWHRSAYKLWKNYLAALEAASPAVQDGGHVHRTNDGRRIPLSQLEDSHLLAILPSLRFSNTRHAYYAEAKRRGLPVAEEPRATAAAMDSAVMMKPTTKATSYRGVEL